MTDNTTNTSTLETEVPADAAPPPPPSGRPPLSRPVDDKVIGGVAAGIARHFGWDPLLVRLGFIVLCFVGGAGFLAYVAGWIMLPRDTDANATRYQQPTDLQDRGLPFWIGVGFLALATLALFGGDGIIDAGFVVAIALVAVGVAIWKSGDRAEASSRPRPSRPATDFADTEESVDDATTMSLPAGPAAPAPPTPATVVAADDGRPAEPKSYLGRVMFGLSLLAASIAVALERSDTLDLTAAQLLGVPLVVMAIGLLIGAWWGRARWLVVPALLLCLALPVAAFGEDINFTLGDGIGERWVVVEDVADFAPERLSIGSLTIDLTDIVFDSPDQVVWLEASVGIGELVIRLPDDPSFGWTILATARNGEIRGADGDTVQGRRVVQEFSHEPSDAVGRIHLEAEVGAGVIELLQNTTRRP